METWTQDGVTIHTGDALEVLATMPDDSVDLIFASPPYEAARTYSIDFKLRGQAWVDWGVERYLECVRVSRGLVAWVVEGQTRKFQWSATPALLMSDLHRAGVRLRKPPIFYRVGIPGSGGPDWWRNDYEFVICASKGKLPWSDNTAIGHIPKYDAGGDPSNRKPDGQRVNRKIAGGRRIPKIDNFLNNGGPPGSKMHTKTEANGEKRTQCYIPPELANPGNVIKVNVGGGLLGSDLAHENEAPFPISLVYPFIVSFCPPGGTVCDCFCGSGTTLVCAINNGRRAIGIDVRESQVELSKKRIGLECQQRKLFT